MPALKLFTAAALAGLLAAGPVLTVDALAAGKSRASKASSRAKAKAAAPAAAEAAQPAAAAEATAEAEAPSAPEQQIATSNPAAAIPAVLQASGQFTTLLKAVQATNLGSVVGGARAITLFAPTDQAFAALPPGIVAALMTPANAATLQRILTYHIVATKLPAAQVRGKAAAPVPTASGASVTVSGTGGVIKVGDATVIQSDVQASNGVIHVIDKVLMPAGVTLPAPAAGGAVISGAASTGASTATASGPPGMASGSPASPGGAAAGSATSPGATTAPTTAVAPR